jgi:hypothetical protein
VARAGGSRPAGDPCAGNEPMTKARFSLLISAIGIAARGNATIEREIALAGGSRHSPNRAAERLIQQIKFFHGRVRRWRRRQGCRRRFVRGGCAQAVGGLLRRFRPLGLDPCCPA